MTQIEQLITSVDLPPVIRHKALTSCIVDQQSFDALCRYFYHPNKHIVRYAADVLAKITLKNPSYVQSHKSEVLSLLSNTANIGLKAHAALMASRLTVTEDELGKLWHLLTTYTLDTKEAKSVRVSSLQGLYNLLGQCPELKEDFIHTISAIKEEEAPSLKAKIRACHYDR
ncbi:MAG: hypothetical protein LBK45_06235 [Tannerellaceae bacterium]|nr:hypothetical protein [Tannerellaceae bacterium]